MTRYRTSQVTLINNVTVQLVTVNVRSDIILGLGQQGSGGVPAR
jgi:hypothetical protein